MDSRINSTMAAIAAHITVRPQGTARLSLFLNAWSVFINLYDTG
jgi:hypothetical protein